MGKKVNPIGFRTGVSKDWKSRWFIDDSRYKEYLYEDIQIRRHLMDKLRIAGISLVEIERLPKSMKIALTVSRPGVVIGRGGSGLEEIKKELVRIINMAEKTNSQNMKIDIDVKEVKNPDKSAQLVASRIASDLERRMPHRRTVTKSIDRVMQSGAKGIKVELGGRINGADIARREIFKDGSVPTQTLRADVDYAQVPALLKRGYVGVKVWIYRGEEE